MLIAVFARNRAPATPLLLALADSLRTFGHKVRGYNPDFVNPKQHAFFDGAVALDDVDFDLITRTTYETLTPDGRMYVTREADNFAGPENTIVLHFAEGRLALGDKSWDMEDIKDGDMARFLVSERVREPKVEVVKPLMADADSDVSGLPPPATTGSV